MNEGVVPNRCNFPQDDSEAHSKNELLTERCQVIDASPFTLFFTGVLIAPDYVLSLIHI